MRLNAAWVIVAGLCFCGAVVAAEPATVPAFLKVKPQAGATRSPRRVNPVTAPRQVDAPVNMPSASPATGEAGVPGYSGPSLMSLSIEQTELAQLRLRYERAKLEADIAQLNSQRSGATAAIESVPPQVVQTSVAGGEASAVLQLADGSRMTVRRGDRLPGGYVVSSISGRSVMVRRGRDRLTLAFFHVAQFSGTNFSSLPPPPPVPTAPGSGGRGA